MIAVSRFALNGFLIVGLCLVGKAAESPGTDSPGAALTAAQLSRGKLLYLQNCVMCHQSSGEGSPGVFPPLAKSDYLAGKASRSVLALVQGLSGPLTVNGRKYNGAMPPANLDDQKVAEVLNYVRNSFGNTGEVIRAEQVKEVRATSRFPTFEVLQRASAYPKLPPPPAGFALREVARLPDNGVRLASDGQGKALYVLCLNGDVWRVELPGGQLRQVLRGDDYIDLKRGNPSAVGLTLDAQKRFYIVTDQRHEGGPVVTNEVTIFRTTATENGEPAQPKAWFQTAYPWGIGPFNHGVGHVATGPDGMIYVSSGSRTDGNEPGKDAHYFQGGEVPLTACVWRFDPRAEQPELEIFARGLRNPYGFCWNDQGEMFATDNGPDADAPEELNFVERGKHYGFPFQFSDWSTKPYAYTPEKPAGVEFTFPVANLGPAGGAVEGKPMSTFDPHSSPAGIVFLGNDFPADYRGTFLVARFGNLIKTTKDSGFDVLQMQLRKNAQGRYESKTTSLLAPLGRPIDVHLAGQGKIYICEYTRQTDNKAEVGMLPGRILEMSVKR